MTQNHNPRMSTEDNELALLNDQGAQRLLEVFSEENFDKGFNANLNSEIVNFIDQIYRVALRKEVQLAVIDVAHDGRVLDADLVTSLLLISAAQVTVPRELAVLTVHSAGLREMARKELKGALEDLRVITSSDDAGVMNRIELALAKLEQKAARAVA